MMQQQQPQDVKQTPPSCGEKTNETMKDVDPTKHSTPTPTPPTTASPTTTTPPSSHRPSLLTSAGKVEPIRRSSLPMKKRKSFQIEVPPPMLSAADIKECGLSDDDDDDGMDDVDTNDCRSNKEQQQLQLGNNNNKGRPSKRRANHGFGVSPPTPMAAASSSSPIATSSIEEEGGLTPQINDVLISSSSNSNSNSNTTNNQSNNNNQSSTFNHIGNRRFRVLVEANLSGYFGHLTTPQEWEAALSMDNNSSKISSKNSSEGIGIGEEGDTVGSTRGTQEEERMFYTPKQTQVVSSVIESVKGNVPSGRFLLQVQLKDNSDKGKDATNVEKEEGAEGEEDECKQWRLATPNEITTKVHLTFAAAGRFHVMQNAALLMDMQQQQLDQEQIVDQEQQVQVQFQPGQLQPGQPEEEEDAPISHQQTMAKKEDSSTNKTTVMKQKKKRTLLSQSSSLSQASSATATSNGNASCSSGLCGNVLSQRGLDQLAARAAEAAQEQYDVCREEREVESDLVVKKAIELQKRMMGNNGGGGGEALEEEAAASAVQMDDEPTSSSSSSDLEDEEGGEEEEPRIIAASSGKKEEEDGVIKTQVGTLKKKKKALLLNKAASASSEGAIKDALLLQAAATSRQGKGSSANANNKLNSSSSSNNKLDFLLAQAAKLNNGTAAGHNQSSHNNNVAKYLPSRQGGGTTRRNNHTMRSSSSSSTISTTAESLLAATSGEGLIHQSRLEKKTKRFVPTSIDELFKAAAEAAKTSTEVQSLSAATSPVGAAAAAVASGMSSSATTSPQVSSSSEEGGSSSCISPSFPLVSGLLSSGIKRRGSQGDTMTGEQATATGGMQLMACPARIKVFLFLPMDKFFVEEEEDCNNAIMDTSSHAVPPTVAPSSYIVPSNYDILCGPGQSFFHHIGNRRFRIMIEMNAYRYEQAYLSSLSNNNNGTTTTTTSSGGILEDGPVQRLLDEILASLSKCDPAGRFLGMEMTTGRWRVLNHIFCRLKIEQTFFECVQVKQRRQAREQQEEQQVLQQQQQLEMGQQEEEEEWKCRVEQEKEMLLVELNSRMGATAGAGFGNNNNNTIEQSALMALASQQMTNGTQPLSQVSASDGNLMSLLDPKTDENGGELSALQSRAKASLRRRQFQASVQQSMGQLITSSNEDPHALEKIVAMSEMVRAIREQQQTSRSLMESFRNNSAVGTGMEAQQQLRRSSLPVLSGSSSLGLGASALTSSFTSTLSNRGSLNGGQSPFSVVPHQQHRGSILSRDSNDSLQSMSGQVMEHGSRTQLQQTTVPGASPQANTSLPSNKDLLDVVGGMMMMSRRGSC